MRRRISKMKLAEVNVAIDQTKVMSDDLKDLLIQQVANEMYASYSYLSMSIWLTCQGLENVAKYMKAWSDQEIGHAEKILDLLVRSGDISTLPPISEPELQFVDIVDMANSVMEHEKGITEDWRIINEVASDERSYAIKKLSQWFADEQLEEEDKAMKLVQHAQMALNKSGLLVLDNLMGDLQD